MYILSINKAGDVIAYSEDMNDDVNLIAWIILYLVHMGNLKKHDIYSCSVISLSSKLTVRTYVETSLVANLTGANKKQMTMDL